MPAITNLGVQKILNGQQQQGKWIWLIEVKLAMVVALETDCS